MAIKDGDKVKVHYTGSLEDGSIFDSSKGKEALEFTVGEHQMIPGFEEAVKGMEKGETKEVTLEPKDAYGDVRDDLVIQFKKGDQLYLFHPDGKPIPATITDLSNGVLTLDANHQLAGKTLKFEINIEDIK